MSSQTTRNSADSWVKKATGLSPGSMAPLSSAAQAAANAFVNTNLNQVCVYLSSIKFVVSFDFWFFARWGTFSEKKLFLGNSNFKKNTHTNSSLTDQFSRSLLYRTRLRFRVLTGLNDIRFLQLGWNGRRFTKIDVLEPAKSFFGECEHARAEIFWPVERKVIRSVFAVTYAGARIR